MSLCNPPSISISVPDFDIIALLEDLLSLFGITLPQMPTISLPAPFCPLDILP